MLPYFLTKFTRPQPTMVDNKLENCITKKWEKEKEKEKTRKHILDHYLASGPRSASRSTTLISIELMPSCSLAASISKESLSSATM